jgi:hypothetical protein
VSRWRRDAPATSGARQYLLEQLVHLDETYRGAVGGRTPWARSAARLEAGEPLEVHGWQLPDSVRTDWGITVNDWVRVNADDSLNVLKRWPW